MNGDLDDPRPPQDPSRGHDPVDTSPPLGIGLSSFEHPPTRSRTARKARTRPLDAAIVGLSGGVPVGRSRSLDRFEPLETRMAVAVGDALEDAGLPPGMPAARRVALFVAIGDRDSGSCREDVLAAESISGTVARALGFTGQALDVRADGGSAPAAIELAARTLLGRRADLAIVAEPGETCRALVLKRLDDAERDGHRIYGVIKALEIDPDADKAARRAFRKAGAPDGSIPFVLPAEGLGGMFRAARSLHHRLRHDGQDGDRPWIHGDAGLPRRVGVASIGGYAVVDEHEASADDPTAPGLLPDWPTEAILLAAPDRASWRRLANGLLDWLDDGPAPGDSLADLARTLNVGVPDHPFRVGLVASSFVDLRDRLAQVSERLSDPNCRAIRDGRGAYHWAEPLGGPGRLAFLFPGEGSQYPGMLADLCPHFPELRAAFDGADRVAAARGVGLLPSAAVFGDGVDPPASERLWEVGNALSVVLSGQWGLRQVLTRLGLRPDAVLGHSSGELLALGAAGSIRVDRRFEDKLRGLGDLFAAVERQGKVPEAALLAVAAERDQVAGLFRDWDVPAALAMDNCPHQTVWALRLDEAETVAARLRVAGLSCERLPFTRAYHTPAFEEALDPLRAFFGGLRIAAPKVPLYSCATATRLADDPAAVADAAISQWVRPVEFRRAIEAMHADGVRVFVEVGTRGNLTGFVEDVLRGKPAFAVAANLPKRPGPTQLHHLVASLFAQGVPIVPDHLYVRRRARRLDLHRRARIEAGSETTSGRAAPAPPSPLPESVAVASSPPSPSTTAPPAFEPPPPARIAVDDEAVVAYLKTMEEFLEVQGTVISAYRARSSGGTPPEGIEDFEPSPTGGPMIPWAPSTFSAVSELNPIPFETGRGRFRGGWGRPDPRTPGDGDTDWGQDDPSHPEHSDSEAGLGLDRSSKSGTPAMIPAHGPWLGEVQDFDSGTSLRAIRRLDPNDPVAREHTLGGRRISAVEPGRLGLPVMPFAAMAEMLAEAGSALLPGRAVIGLKSVQAHRWIEYRDEPVTLEILATTDPARPDEVRVSIHNRCMTNSRAEAAGPVVEGVVVLADDREPGPIVPSSPLPDPGPCRFEADELYDDAWLFHGPAFRALTEIGSASPAGIEGTITIRPATSLLPPGETRPLVLDPIAFDAFTQLLGCWGLDRLPEGNIIFPLRLGSLELLGTNPTVGERIACRVAVRRIERHKVLVDADLVRTDGRAWMRIRDWEDWRFYWPAPCRDQFRAPDRFFPGERFEPAGLPNSAALVWFEPPADFVRPIWREVLAAVQLGAVELREWRELSGPERRKTLRLWGRVAAKEAARRLVEDHGAPPSYPADWSVVPDDHGRPTLRTPLNWGWPDAPAISIAHTDGVALALAAVEGKLRPGVDIERITPREPRFEELAFCEGERALLDRVAGNDPGARAEWVARLWCAKEAAGKASGRGLIVGPASVAVVGADPADSDILLVSYGAALQAADPALGSEPIRVTTGRRGDFAWAWTLGEPSGGLEE